MHRRLALIQLSTHTPCPSASTVNHKVMDTTMPRTYRYLLLRQLLEALRNPQGTYEHMAWE